MGVAAHPHNQPRLDASGRRVVAGYGILQPRIATPLPAPRGLHALPLAVRRPVRHRPLQRRQLRGLPGPVRRGQLHRQGPARTCRPCTRCWPAACPQDQVLSHDLLEGAHGALRRGERHHADRGRARSTPTWPPRACTAGRVATGSCCPSCCARGATACARSTAGRCSTTCAARWWRRCRWRCCCWRWRARPPVAAGRCWRWSLAAFAAGPLMGAVAGLAPSRDDVALAPFLPPGGWSTWRARCGGGLWHLAQLLQHALLARRRRRCARCSAWRSAGATCCNGPPPPAAQAAASDRPAARCVRQHWRRAAGALLLLARRCWRCGTPYPALAGAAVPAVGRHAGVDLAGPAAPGPRARRSALSRSRPRPTCDGVARDTWRLFERCVGAGRPPPAARQPADRAARHGGAPHLADQHRPVPAERGLRAPVRLDRHARSCWRACEATLATLDALAAPPRPLPELVRHADAARRCCRCTCPPSTAAT